MVPLVLFEKFSCICSPFIGSVRTPLFIKGSGIRPFFLMIFMMLAPLKKSSGILIDMVGVSAGGIEKSSI